MPELPEVETIRRGLVPVMEGSWIERIEVRRTDLRFPVPNNFAKCLEGRKLEKLWRRAKYLVGEFDDDTILLIHLGMSGRLRVLPVSVPVSLMIALLCSSAVVPSVAVSESVVLAIATAT